MGMMIDKFRRDALPAGRLPTTEEVIQCIRNPGKYPAVEEYIRNHPEQRALVETVVETVPSLSQELRRRIEHQAYKRFRERDCSHGRDQEDWFIAEEELRQRLASRRV